jgi:hypothetical protein
MAIFAILMPSPQPNLIAEIKRQYSLDHLMLNETQDLISTNGTALELSAKLGIYDIKEPTKAATGLAVIFATSSYFGRAPTSVWEWMKAKLEANPSV